MRPDAALIARTSPGLSHGNTLVPSRLESRLIVFAQGVDFLDSDVADEGWPEDYTVQGYLQGKGIDVTFDDGQAEYITHVQGVRFTVRIETQRDELKAALETDGAHVIYCGHARYGRGPCFSPDNSGPGDHWGNGTGDATGIFRMGYPYIALPVSEITGKRYTMSPVPTSETLTRDDCHPYVRNVSWRGYTLHQLDSTGQLRSQASGSPAAADTFWGYSGRLHGHAGPHLVLHAGWENTATAPLDLGATNMECRVFCHFGCSTFTHNYKILRERKGWQRQGDDRFAYWTTTPDAWIIPAARWWLHHILSYPVYNAFEPWEDSIRYALRKTNQQLRRVGASAQFR